MSASARTHGLKNMAPFYSGAVFVIIVVLAYLAPLLSTYVGPYVGPYVGTSYIGLHIALTGFMLTCWRYDMAPQHVMLLGILFRLALILVPAYTTHDVERYLWDGAMVLSGLDPYSVAPDDAAAADLRALWPTPEEHAKYPAIYPPAALYMFAFAALFGPSLGILAWKMIITAASIALLCAGRGLLVHFQKERHLALIALSPLLILEGGIGAHLDTLMALPLVLGLICYLHGKPLLSGLMIGSAIAVKLLPIILLGPLLIHAGITRLSSKSLIVASGVLLALVFFYGSALLLGYQSIGVLPTFFEKWRFGSPIYHMLDTFMSGTTLFITLTGLAFAVMLASILLVGRHLVASLIVVLLVPLILSPVVFPWYLMILVPLVAVRPSATILCWLTTAPLSYEVLNRFEASGVWAPATWPLAVIALGWFLGLIWDFSGRAAPKPVVQNPIAQ